MIRRYLCLEILHKLESLCYIKEILFNETLIIRNGIILLVGVIQTKSNIHKELIACLIVVISLFPHIPHEDGIIKFRTPA